MTITAINKKQAMDLAKQLLEAHELYENEEKSSDAGHPVFLYGGESRRADDFGDRIVVSRDGESLTIVIDPLRDLRYDQVTDALDLLNDILYDIDDKMPSVIEDNTHIGEARRLLYGAWAEIREILIKRFPDRADALIKKFHLDEA
jgi:hypothetical protein